MRTVFFIMPSHPPQPELREDRAFDLQDIRRVDEPGFEEGRVGKHRTAPW